MSLKKIVLAIAALSVSSAAFSHGYINHPDGRAYSCKTQKNIDCGAAQWEPQSLEKTSGFPNKGGPADGKLASAGQPAFAPLDVQTSDRWIKYPIKAGVNKFSWHFTANHVTRNWRYYITKQDWNPNQPLTRDAFELTPFCVIDGGMVQPPYDVTHTCTVPARKGYQIIYGVWEVGDTANSFYNVVDVMFEDGSSAIPSEWSTQIGIIQPFRELKANDRVIARIFDKQGERPNLATELVIGSDAEGEKNTWSHALATKLNETHKDLRAGQKDSQGNVNPSYGQNIIYTQKDSQLKRVEIQLVENEGTQSESLKVSGLKSEYQIKNGQVVLDFDIAVEGKLTVDALVSDYNHIGKAFSRVKIDNATHHFALTAQDVQPGRHMVVIVGAGEEGKPIQEVVDVMFKAEQGTGGGENNEKYDFVFPNNLKEYKAGTRVLQPKTGKVYECKPFPYSGFCIQWKSSANAFEPGVGSAWQQAWIAK